MTQTFKSIVRLNSFYMTFISFCLSTVPDLSSLPPRAMNANSDKCNFSHFLTNILLITCLLNHLVVSNHFQEIFFALESLNSKNSIPIAPRPDESTSLIIFMSSSSVGFCPISSSTFLNSSFSMYPDAFLSKATNAS